MKSNSISFIISIVLFFACSPKSSSTDNVTQDAAFTALEQLEEEIFNYSVGSNKNKLAKMGKALLISSKDYISSHAGDPTLERAYEMAALGAEVSGAYNDAINYLYLAQRNFPTSKKAPIYLFNRARILDDILLKKRESELAYRELIELYPDDSLSLSMKRYLESDLMNKSEQELLEFFNSKK